MACAVSTEGSGAPGGPGAHLAPGDGDEDFDPARRYRLHPGVALRPEPFGALAYHYGNRRLTFLRGPALVALVEALGQHDSAAEALAASGTPESRRGPLTRALASLVRSEVLRAD